MFKIRPCGLLLILTVLLPHFCFSEEDKYTDLLSLVITKQKQPSLSAYSLVSPQAGYFNYESPLEELSSLPLDLQSRSLKSGIQADFSLRGSSYQQVLVSLNGQRVNDPQTGHYNCDIPFTKADMKQAEVMPGAGSSVFGPDAIGGAVDFTLKQPKHTELFLETGMGSFRDGYGLCSVSGKLKSLGLRYSVEDARSKGFRYDTDYKKFTSSLGAYLELPGGGIWENNFGYQDKEYGAYDFYTPGLGYPSRDATKTYLVSSSLSLNQDGLLVKPSFLWRRHFDKFTLDQTQVRSTSVNHHRTDMFTPGFYLQKELGSAGKAGLGLEWGREKITSTNLGRHARDHKSVYLDDVKDFGSRLSSGFSLRLDDFSDFGKVYTGSASARLKLNPALSFNFGISRSMRVPSFTELYYSDPTTIGNSGLTAEKAWNYQGGLEYDREGLFSSLVFFLRREKDMIDWVKSDPSQPWQTENITRDNVFGLEYSLRKRINKIITLNANYTYTDKYTDTQGYLYKYGPNYARHLVNTVFNIDLPFGRQEIGFSYKKRPSRRGWLLMNAGFNYNLTRNYRVFLNATNILNVEYQDIEGIPQPGRYIEAGLAFDW